MDKRVQSTLPCSIASIDNAISGNLLNESLYSISQLPSSDKFGIFVSVCSSENLLQSIPRAAVFLPEIVRQLRFIVPNNVPKVFVARRLNCNIGNDEFPVDIWADHINSRRIQSDGFIDASVIDVQALNFNPGRCQFSDQAKALKTAIGIAKANSNAEISIVGYYIKKTNVVLSRRIETARNFLIRKGVAKERIGAGFKLYTGDPNPSCIDRKFGQPAIFAVTMRP